MNWEKVAESLSLSAQQKLAAGAEHTHGPTGQSLLTTGMILAALAIALSAGLSDAE